MCIEATQMYTSRVAELRAERQRLSQLLQAHDDADTAASGDASVSVDDLQGVPQAELLQAIESNMAAERVSGRDEGQGAVGLLAR
jgi:hypothetical protein